MTQQETVKLVQFTLIEMNEKLDRMIASINAIDVRMTDIESAIVQTNAPSLPPKPKSQATVISVISDDRIYDEVQNSPTVPYRTKGKTFSTQQCEYIKLEMQSVKEYVDASKSKNKEEKLQSQASLNHIISAFTLPKN